MAISFGGSGQSPMPPGGTLTEMFRRINDKLGHVSSKIPDAQNLAAIAAAMQPSADNPFVTKQHSDQLIASALVPLVDVRTFGARGDGHSDDTDALLAAIAACPQKGVVLLPNPSSYYRISGTLEIRKEISIRGGAGLVQLTQVDQAQDVIRYDLPLPAQAARIENLSIIGGLNGIRITGAGAYRDGGINHVEVAGQANACILIDANTWIGTRSSDWNLTASPNGLLLRSIGGGGLNAAAFSNVRISNTFECGAHLDSSPGISSTCHFSNLMFEGNQKLSLWLLNSSADLYTSYYENNGSSGDGQKTTYPDILLDTTFNGTSGGPSRCTLWNGNFSGAYPGNPQGHTRVRFANHECQFMAHNTFWTNSNLDLIDAAGFTIGCAVELHGVGQPSVVNFAGGALLSIQPGNVLPGVNCGIYAGTESPVNQLVAQAPSIYLQRLSNGAGILYVKALGGLSSSNWDRLEAACRTTLDLQNANGGGSANPTINFPTPAHMQPSTPGAPSGYLPISVNGVLKLLPYYDP